MKTNLIQSCPLATALLALPVAKRNSLNAALEPTLTAF